MICLNTFCKIVNVFLLYFECLWGYIHDNRIQTHEQKIVFSKDIHQIIVVAFLACLCIECIIYPKIYNKRPISYCLIRYFSVASSPHFTLDSTCWSLQQRKDIYFLYRWYLGYFYDDWYINEVGIENGVALRHIFK